MAAHGVWYLESRGSGTAWSCRLLCSGINHLSQLLPGAWGAPQTWAAYFSRLLVLNSGCSLVIKGIFKKSGCHPRPRDCALRGLGPTEFSSPPQDSNMGPLPSTRVGDEGPASVLGQHLRDCLSCCSVLPCCCSPSLFSPQCNTTISSALLNNRPSGDVHDCTSSYFLRFPHG